MSQVSQAAAEASTLDWKVVAAAVAVFCGTLVTTVWGWIQKRKSFESSHIKGAGVVDVPIAAGIIQDNQTLREATMVNREVRDQLLILNHALMQYNRNQEETNELLEKICRRLDKRDD
jgi:hypothetical protein